MGREVKRVPLDFDWPQEMRWSGFVNPHYEKRKDCPHCNGGGYNKETGQLADDWYGIKGTGRRWCDNLTQDEVDHLIDEGRLWDFWRRCGPDGWEDIEPRPVVTAEQVNTWEAGGGFGHDSINHMICVRFRAKRLGFYGLCPACDGDGNSWETPQAKTDADAWESTEPPAGGGWQLWETVSEGSPVSPVFKTAEKLAEHLACGGGHPCGEPPTYEQALTFVNAGWAPSMVGDGSGRLVSGVVAVGSNP